MPSFYFTVIEVSSGEYGPQYVEKMVIAIDNGKCSQWAIDAPEISPESHKLGISTNEILV